MALTALRAVKVQTKTSIAGNRGFNPLENAPSEVGGNRLTKAEGGVKPLSMQTAKVRNSQTGFTLFELLLVLFIIGLAGAVAMFSASRLQENTLFNTEARKLYLTVKHAREISILERRDIVFKVDGEAKRYWIDYGDDKTSEMHSIPQKFAIAGEAVNFFPKGNSSGGKFEIDNGKGRKYEVTVDPVLGTTSIKRL
jgi:prepilin-type N-terminal cleavage/methylation domain-containing protein